MCLLTKLPRVTVAEGLASLLMAMPPTMFTVSLSTSFCERALDSIPVSKLLTLALTFPYELEKFAQ